MDKVKLQCGKCRKESEVVPTESGLINYQSGMKRLLRLVCPHCNEAVWRREETLQAEGRIIYGQ